MPRIGIDEALALARQAAASSYSLDLYEVDTCTRMDGRWWIAFSARSIDEVGADWSREDKERWIADGNHFHVTVYDDRTVQLHGGQ